MGVMMTTVNQVRGCEHLKEIKHIDEHRRIGVFGGTFNPIHMGHLMIAEFATEAFGLETTIFVPTGSPPHKGVAIASAADRYQMTALAILDNPRFTISDIEIQRSGVSYTVDTIRELKRQYPKGTEFYFICGTDSIQDLPNWKFNRELLEQAYFIGATRPDGSDFIGNIIDYFGALGKEKIHLLEVPELALSATVLRERLKAGQSVRYIVPDVVIRYIEEHSLYSGNLQIEYFL